VDPTKKQQHKKLQMQNETIKHGRNMWKFKLFKWLCVHASIEMFVVNDVLDDC